MDWLSRQFNSLEEESSSNSSSSSIKDFLQGVSKEVPSLSTSFEKDLFKEIRATEQVSEVSRKEVVSSLANKRKTYTNFTIGIALAAMAILSLTFTKKDANLYNGKLDPYQEKIAIMLEETVVSYSSSSSVAFSEAFEILESDKL